MCFMSAPKVQQPTIPPPPAPPPSPPTIADTRQGANLDAQRQAELEAKRRQARGGTVLTNPLGLSDEAGGETTLLTK